MLKRTYVIVLNLIFLFSLLSGCSAKNEMTTAEKENITYPVCKKQIEDTNYLLDTVYDGSHVMDAVLYEKRFQKSSLYIPNKEFIRYISENQEKAMLDAYTSFIDCLFNNGYRNVLAGQDAFMEDIKDIVCPGTYIIENEEIPLDDYVNKVRDWYIDNKIQLQADGETDRSLIWEDGSICVRGYISLNPYSEIDGDLFNSLFGFQINNTGETKLILELTLTAVKDGYQVTGWEIIE